MKFDSEKLEIKTFPANEVPAGWSVLDINPESAGETMEMVLKGARTVFYNGAAGLRENKLFAKGTKEIIFMLAEFKKINPKAKIVVLGGDGSAAFVEELGEDKAKEVAYLISEMGGSAWNYLTGEYLSALSQIHSKDFAKIAEPSLENGIVDYSGLATINDMPEYFWWFKKDVLVIADVNIGKTSKEIKSSKMRRVNSLVNVIKHLKQKVGDDGKIIVISHNGRFREYYKKLKHIPPDGTVDPDYGIKPITEIVTTLLRKEGVFDETEEITFVPYSVLPENPEKLEIKKGNIIFLENPRFWKADETKDKVEAVAHAGKIWEAVRFIGNPQICVQTALGALHRGNQPSRGIIIGLFPGPKVISLPVREELAKLFEVGAKPVRPILAIVQGAKPDKIEDVIKPLIDKKKVDGIFIGGKIAMPFVNKEPLAMEIMKLAKENSIEIFLPKKVVAARIPEGITEEEFISILKK